MLKRPKRELTNHVLAVLALDGSVQPGSPEAGVRAFVRAVGERVAEVDGRRGGRQRLPRGPLALLDQLAIEAANGLMPLADLDGLAALLAYQMFISAGLFAAFAGADGVLGLSRHLAVADGFGRGSSAALLAVASAAWTASYAVCDDACDPPPPPRSGILGTFGTGGAARLPHVATAALVLRGRPIAGLADPEEQLFRGRDAVAALGHPEGAAVLDRYDEEHDDLVRSRTRRDGEQEGQGSPEWFLTARGVLRLLAESERAADGDERQATSDVPAARPVDEGRRPAPSASPPGTQQSGMLGFLLERARLRRLEGLLGAAETVLGTLHDRLSAGDPDDVAVRGRKAQVDALLSDLRSRVRGKCPPMDPASPPARHL